MNLWLGYKVSCYLILSASVSFVLLSFLPLYLYMLFHLLSVWLFPFCLSIHFSSIQFFTFLFLFRILFVSFFMSIILGIFAYICALTLFSHFLSFYCLLVWPPVYQSAFYLLISSPLCFSIDLCRLTLSYSHRFSSLIQVSVCLWEGPA